MIGYYGSAYKIFWYFYSIFTALLYFNYLGMMLVSLTPNFIIAAIMSSVFYTLFNLFAGFLIPKPVSLETHQKPSFLTPKEKRCHYNPCVYFQQVPKWWIWLYYLTPTSWSLNGMLTSQYGDIDKEVEIFGQLQNVNLFLKDYFGFDRDRLPVVAVVLIAFPIAYASVFAFCIRSMNFQKR